MRDLIVVPRDTFEELVDIAAEHTSCHGTVIEAREILDGAPLSEVEKKEIEVAVRNGKRGRTRRGTEFQLVGFFDSTDLERMAYLLDRSQ